MFRMTQSFRRYKYFIALLGFFLFLLFFYSSRPCSINNTTSVEVVSSEKQRVNRQEPLIFIGGMPRSGTTLARVMLDAHPDIRCGEETRVVPRILQMRKKWKASPKEHMRLQEAGVTDEVIDDAVASFVLHIIVNHGSDAKKMCNKDPFTMKSAAYLSELFPNSKFLFMIRDGRATVHSIISRKITITGFDLSSYRQCLGKWNAAMTAMKAECDNLGPNKCLPVYYEKLVLNPKEWMEKILTFLEIEWSDLVLKHETLINQPNGISLSKVERSSDQVIAPVNINALSKWVGNIPKDVLEEMDEIAPMLRTLGYDPHANPPNYGEADSMVLDNTLKLSKNAKQYEEIANQVRSRSKDETEKD